VEPLEVTVDKDKKAAEKDPDLKGLTPRERELVKEVMAAHPDLSAETAIAMLRRAGM
jgi:hypothetical protein